MTATSVPDRSWVIGKHAILSLRALRRNGRTEVDPIARRTPYQWQGVHYQDHDDQPFLLVHNSAGGFVEGDVAELTIHAEPGTRTLMTTSAATKYYKCEEEGEAHDLVTITAGADALFEYLPDEVIPFAGSRIMRRTRIWLEASSRAFVADALAAGRVHYGSGEAFQFTSLRSELELRVGGQLMLLDRLDVPNAVDTEALQRLWHGRHYLGTVVVHAPDLSAEMAELLAAQTPLADGVLLGVSHRGNILCARVLAREAWQLHAAIYRIWEALRPALAGKPARPISK